MEAVEESPGTATRGDCFFEPRPAIHRDQDGKTLGDAQKASGSVENTQDDGARVSTNGKEALSGDFGGDYGEKVQTKVVETQTSENLDASGVGAEGLEDSEMNGVSSLLKMKRDFGEKDNGVSFNMENTRKELDAKVGSLSETKDREEEEEEEEIDGEEHKFHVGDFVWGKIKSHPWWPGQIYDSSEASDLALKIKQKGRLLVAYFGDGTFAWCHPSQLKPFEENFNELSKISSSKSFTNAVEDAVEEMGRQVELIISSSCVPEEHLDGIDKPVAENAGIKEGVLVPQVRKETMHALKYEPKEILGHIKNLAKVVILSDLLEYEMLKRKVSAFCTAKGGYKLPEYYGPQPIPGLEDENIERAVNLRSFKGSSEEDLINSEKPNGRSLEKCSGFPEDRLYHRRKQKSIAEILEADMNTQAKGDKSFRSVSPSSKKKRKGSDEAKHDSGNNKLTSTPRRRRIGELFSAENFGPREKDVIVESPKSRKRKNRDSNWQSNDGGENEGKEKKGSVLENDCDMSPLASLRKKIKIDVSNVEKDDSNKGGATVQTPNDSLSRERKKSKYLSPPYTTEFNWKGKKNEIEAESVTVSSQALVGERIANVAGQIIETNQEKPSKEPDFTNELTDDSGHQEPKDDQRKVIDISKVEASAKKLLDLIRAVALSPQYADENSSHDLLGEFISMYRSFTYHDGSNYRIYTKQESGKKEETRQIEKDDEIEAEEAKKKKDTKAEKPKVKQQSIESDSKSVNNTEIDTQVSKAELFVTFGPSSSLPTKDDLVRIYGMFGPLNKERTDMFYNNFYARVAFLNTSDAEEAFYSSQNASPFVSSSTLSFRLRYLSASPENPNQKLSPIEEQRRKKKSENIPSLNPSQDAESSSQVNYVKEKLEVMRSMLGESEGRMSVKLKSRLEAEMRKLLEKVSSMVVSSS